MNEKYKNEDGSWENDLSRANLQRADFSGANLRRADLSEANFPGADLSGANLSEANLSEANLSGADLSGADLSGADLSGANLSGANLSEADLSEADLSGADLSGARNKNFYVFVGPKHTLIAVDGQIQIGCEIHSADEWLKNGVQIGIRNGYSDLDIKIYGDFIKFVSGAMKNEKQD